MDLKTVTVLSAELTGFDELTGTLSAKEFNILLSEIHGLADSTTRLHHGILTHFSGDTFQAVFSIEKSISQQAQQGLEAIFEFRERLETSLSEKKLPINVRFKAGIASGEGTIGKIDTHGDKLISVMGPAVNFAGRLREFAEPGQTLVNGPLFEDTNERFDFSKLEPLPLRGSKESLSVYELLGRKRKKVIQETRSERKIGSEMVGRGHEMDLIEGQVRKLISGKGSVVNVVGKAGIGKSRLISELKAQDWLGKVAVLEGRAQSMGRNLSFHPIIQLIKSWSGIREEDSQATSAEKLQDSIRSVSLEQSEEIFPFIATMMGLPLTGKYKERTASIEGEALEKLILKNLRDLVTLASKVRPVVIILEDLHWSDNSSILFLESLFRLSTNHPVLFINIFRPGFEETSVYLLNFQAEHLPEDHLILQIEPLVKNESLNLIGNLLHNNTLPSDINDLIIRKTEGNPFFIEEVIRSFIDDGIIEIHENKFQVTAKIHQVNIPESINEVILSRVDKLDEKTRELLKTASVIGRNFYYKVLEEAADTIGEIDDRLEYLKEVQLISETKKKEEIEYLFKHALAQQATYESILQNSKKELHLKIARSIEKVFAGNLNEFYGTLAYHYEQGENLQKTEEYLVLAGEESLQSGAPHEAYPFLKKGLEIFQKESAGNPETEKLGSYYALLAVTCHSGGLNLEAIDYIDKYQELYHSSFPATKTLFAAGILWRIANFILALNFPALYFRKIPTEQEEVLIKLMITKGESMVTITPKRVFTELLYFSNRLVRLDLSKTNYGLGLFTEYAGNFFWTGISPSLGRKILTIAEKYITEENRHIWMKLRYVKAVSKMSSGEFTPDTDEKNVFSTGMSAGAFWETTTYLIFSNYLHVENGNWQKSAETRNRLLETAETFENIHARVQYHRSTGLALSKFRKLDEILETTDKSIEMISRTGHASILMLVRCYRIQALTLCSDFEEALRLLQMAEEVAVGLKRGVLFYSTFLCTKSNFLIARIKHKERRKIPAGEQRELLKTTGETIKYSKMFPGNLIEAYRLHAIALDMAGKPSGALMYFQKSLAFAEQSNGLLELSRTCFELGKFLTGQKSGHTKLNGLSGTDYLGKARILFEEMNLQWDLQEYERMMKSR